MSVQQKSVDAIRILSAEQIEKAQSGHPGICMGAAPMGYELFADTMKYSYNNPGWDNRDRFVLSAGHGSAMLYSLLHLFGFDVTKTDLENFRQLDSRTPGHPERDKTPGVEASTGPLGQGIANAVGMAVAEAHLAALFNRPGYDIVDHYTYVLCGEGCLEEGIGYEACSFAGTQQLGKLILLYDCNKISIEGDVSTAFSEDIATRFIAQGWQVIRVADANNLAALKVALERAKSDLGRPSILICNTRIGYGSPLEGSAACHGSPLGEANLAQSKLKFGWTSEPFTVPDDVREHCLAIAQEKTRYEAEWNVLFSSYSSEYPMLAAQYKQFMSGSAPDFGAIDGLWDFTKPEATRSCGGKIINMIAKISPNLMSGSADLAPSTKTDIKGSAYFSPEHREGCNIHFGIREHAMSAICNGIQLHGGLRAICSTFFTFVDYMKGGVRMSALMDLPVTYVLTHDSIGVGEDGPTHQPVEQLVMLRSMPGINVFRPCDGKETAAAFISAFTSGHPTAIVESRQNLPAYDGTGADALKGGYILSDCEGTPDVLLIGTGSEVELCMEAKEQLKAEGIKARVVSMPCTELFEAQSREYRESVLPPSVKARVCVEAASSYSWYKYGKDYGEYVTMSRFGASGNAKQLFERFGFTAENVASKAKLSLENVRLDRSNI